MPQSPFEMFRSAKSADEKVLSASGVNLDEFESVSLEAAVCMALEVLKEAVVKVSLWSLKGNVSVLIPSLEQSAQSADYVVKGYLAGFPWLWMASQVRELYKGIADVGYGIAGYSLGGVSAGSPPRSSPRRDFGYLLWSFGFHMSEHCEIEGPGASPCRLNPLLGSVSVINSGVNSLVADRLLYSAGFGSGTKLASAFLDVCAAQASAERGGAEGAE